jgi:Domain of unknown function (DUF4337)
MRRRRVKKVMEANEVGELQEQAEHGSEDSASKAVAFTMSILAVLVAVVTVMGHRTHTQAVLYQAKASDAWNFYQAKNVRDTVTDRALGLLAVTNPVDKDKAQQLAKDWADKRAKWTVDLKQEEEKARDLEEKVEQAEARANRFDLGEALLEIALVISSITLLTKKRIYWMLGLVFGVGGILVAGSGLLLLLVH